MGIRIYCDGRLPIQVTLKRFKKRQEQARFFWEMRRREAYLDKTQVRRTKEFKRRLKARKQELDRQLAMTPSAQKRKELLAEFQRKRGKP